VSQEHYEVTFREAVQHHREGRLTEAEAAYRRAIALRPDEGDAIQMLGVLIAQSGRLEEGVEVIRKAIAASPARGDYHANLGYMLATSGRLEESVTEFREALSRMPPSPEVLGALGGTLHRLKRLPEAIDCYTAAARLRPDLPGLLENLCTALAESGRGAELETTIRRMLSLRPGWAFAWFRLGNLLHGEGRYAEAVEAYRRCLAIEPSVAARHNLGSALRGAKRPQEAIEQYQLAASSGLDGFELRYHMGLALFDVGELEQSASWLRRALELKRDPEVASGVIFALYHLPDTKPDEIHEALLGWNQTYARPLACPIKPHLNDRTPERRLRVGYVARHLGNHPVGRFLLQLLRHHDREGFEIYCYCDDGTDAIGLRLREHIDVWRTTQDVSDEELAERIRQDRVDILVDLMMHAGANRLMTFARKPAPVQVSYLAYPGTTGLETMDFRLTDRFLEPTDMTEELALGGKPVRLPHSFWCYLEPPEAPPVGPLPANAGGGITFGSLNNDNKINYRVVEAWARILSQVAGSRLAVMSIDGPKRQRVSGLLARYGVDPKRVRFVSGQSLPDYFAEFNRIDIGLDTFPYPGGTTTLDAICMGVPVVTLGGATPISRGGVSILSNLDLQSLIAWDADQYVRTASDLGRNLETVRAMRAGLRDRLQTSAMMDGPGFARDVESAYRLMWRSWSARMTTEA
jgi:predicted O-linked N-acetylglucosamine transferase (SPINDLY family)